MELAAANPVDREPTGMQNQKSKIPSVSLCLWKDLFVHEVANHGLVYVGRGLLKP